MSAKDGGPAFPVECQWNDYEKRAVGIQTGPSTGFATGLSVRDYFAAKALGGMLGGEPGFHLVPSTAVRLAYDYADAMLKARES